MKFFSLKGIIITVLINWYIFLFGVIVGICFGFLLAWFGAMGGVGLVGNVFLFGLGVVLGWNVGVYLLGYILARLRRSNQDGDTELLGVTTVTHRFVEAKGIRWHFVEAGEGEPVIFLHGVPSSWYMWHHQLEVLAQDYHVISIDLKGYGQSDKGDGDFRQENVAEELLALFDTLGFDKINIVAHDRGAVIADYLGANHPERVLSYVRAQQILHIWDPELSPQEVLFLGGGSFAMRFPRLFVPLAYSALSPTKFPFKLVKREIKEFAYPGIAHCVPLYFKSSSFAKEQEDRKSRLCKAMEFPVLLLQAGNDRGQPRYYYDGIEEQGCAIDQFPNAALKYIENVGHFFVGEKPEIVTKIIREFLKKSLDKK